MVEPIPLSRPDIGPAEIEAVTAVMQTPFLSLGPKLREFEEHLEQRLGSPNAVATSSGTAGLHLCLRTLRLQPGDEVITTPFSFIASANVLLFENLVPVFVDIDPLSLNLDPEGIVEAMTPRTKAILVVHAFGNPANMPRIMEIARKHDLRVIEDACEAMGSRINGKSVGTFGDLGTLAFYPNKQMTTGEGGAVLAQQNSHADLLCCLRNQGRKPTGAWLDMEELGYNYRMNDMLCALGIAQLQRLDEILEKRRGVAARYDQLLGDIPEILLPPRTSSPSDMSWFVYVVRLSEDFTQQDRDEIFQGMAAQGISCGRYFAPIHLQPYYQKLGFRQGQFPLTEAAGKRALALPFFNQLTQAQAERVSQCLLENIHRVKTIQT